MDRPAFCKMVAAVAGVPSIRLREHLSRVAKGVSEEVELLWADVRHPAAMQALVTCDDVAVEDGEAGIVARLRTK